MYDEAVGYIVDHSCVWQIDVSQMSGTCCCW